MAIHTDKSFESVVSFTIELYDLLKKMGIRDHTGQWLNFLHWKSNMSEEQAQARSLMDSIVKITCEQNNQISARLIYEKILYGLIQKAIWYTKEYPDFPASVRDEIKILFDYRAQRTVDIPLVYIISDGQTKKFGLMTIVNMTKDDWQQQWGDNIRRSGGDEESVRSYARVVCDGDVEKSRENAIKIVTDMLVFLRAVGFPFTTKQKNLFGLLNENAITSLPYRIHRAKENNRLESAEQLSTTVSTLQTYELCEDLLNQLSSVTLSKLQKLIEDDYLKPSTEIKRKFFLALRWLGDATKPDTIEGRFAKLAFSLEALIGGDAKKEMLSARGLAATLAERAAFLVGKNQTERQKIHSQVHAYYGLRSGIVHGGDKRISDEQLAGFALLVREVIWALLNRIDDFQNIDSLQEWVFSQRYS